MSAHPNAQMGKYPFFPVLFSQKLPGFKQYHFAFSNAQT